MKPATKGRSKPKASNADNQGAPPWTHGTFHWNELRTRHAAKIMKFYTAALGWTFERMATPAGEDYWLAMAGGQPVAGLFTLVPGQFDNVPESWIGYIAVDDVDARVAKALKAGAKLMMPIFDIPNVGRVAMLMEPGGAGIGWMTPVGPQRKA